MIKIDIYRKLLGFFGLIDDVIAGLEISEDVVRLLQLSKHYGKIRVDHYAVESILDHANLLAAINNAIIKSKLKTKTVCVAISNMLVMSKIIKIPSISSNNDWSNQIASEIDKHFPFVIKELAFDYCIINPTIEQDELEVLLTVAKLEDIKAIIDIVHAADLVPAVIDVDAYAIARAFLNIVPNAAGNIMLFEITAKYIIIIVIKDSLVWYVRQQRWQQEHYLLSVFMQMYAEYNDNSNKIIIESIYLSGSAAHMAGLDELLEAQLQIKCYSVEQFAYEDLEPELKGHYWNKNFGLGMNCYGLALRNIH